MGVSLVCTAGLALTPLAALPGSAFAQVPAGEGESSAFAQAAPAVEDPAQENAAGGDPGNPPASAPGPAPAADPDSSLLAEGSSTARATAAPGAPDPATSLELGLVPNPAPRFARVAIDKITPQVADGAPGSDAVDGIPLVTVSGTITNSTDQAISDVSVRLQRGEGTSDTSAVRSQLSASTAAFGVAGPEHVLDGTIAPGESMDFEISLPLAAVRGPSLQIDTPGVYPLLASAQGTVEGQGAVALDSARTLLPVLPSALRLVPGYADSPAGRAELGTDGSSQAPAKSPVSELTIVYPLSANPTRRAVRPGLDGPSPTVHLTDDSLLGELAAGGRLSGLLDALEGAESEQPELKDAVCLAIDPELLRTVDDIASGQRVVVDGADEAREITDAKETASSWLDRLRAMAGNHCTVALPPASADIDAVAATGSTALADAFGAGARSEINRVLGVADPVDATIPTKGTIAQSTLDSMKQASERPAIVAASGLCTPSGGIPRSGTHRLEGSGQTALAYDPYLATALSATGAVPENPRYSDPEQRYWLESDSAEARLQDARSAVIAPVLADMADSQAASQTDSSTDDSGDTPDAPAEQGRKVLLMPPSVWTLDDAGVRSILDTASSQITAGHMRPVGLAEALAQPPAGGVDPTGQDAGDGESGGESGDGGGDNGAGAAAEPVRSDPARLGLSITPDTLGDDSAEASGYVAPTAPDGSPIPDADPGAVDIGTITRVRRAMSKVDVIRRLVDTSDPTANSADAFIDPLRSEALRALSTTFRRAGGDGSIRAVGLDAGDPAAGPDTGRLARDAGVGSARRLESAADESIAAVTLIPPGAVYTMASPNSPLLLVARNELPFPVRVALRVDTPPGMEVQDPGLISVPASGSRTMQLPAESTESGTRTGITIALESADGYALSDPVDVEVQTGGSRLAWIFALVAGLLALLLMARRYVTVRRGKASEGDAETAAPGGEQDSGPEPDPRPGPGSERGPEPDDGADNGDEHDNPSDRQSPQDWRSR
ncbi:hypothetical protein [Dietzia sp.]|uniref:hypothetical protein n=1 Tax=Dietzia sp. TaxID=1871616 RepID=UPI002FDA2C4E